MSRTRTVFYCGASAICILAGWLWLVKGRSNNASERVPQSSNQVASAAKADSNSQPHLSVISNNGLTNTVDPLADVREYVRQREADPQFDWKRPIIFFGRAIDQNNATVPEVTVDFKWNDLSAEGTSATTILSDSDGFFSLKDRRGKRLYVQVHKDGYYSSRRDAIAFEYANPADGLFKPDPTNPIVFHLRKKGNGATLVTSQYGAKDSLGVTVPLDGSPVHVDLLARRAGNAGVLIVRQKKPAYEHWKQATEWEFRMEIPDGGFIVQNDEFPFEAPESGYQPIVEFKFQKTGTNWTDALTEKYYIKFGSPPRYGWLQLQTAIEMKGARLTYQINPEGSRNLEPK